MLIIPGNARLFLYQHPMSMRKSFESLSAAIQVLFPGELHSGAFFIFLNFKRQLFGKRSERVAANLNEQQLTFEGFEISRPPEQETKEIPAHTRKKPKRDGQDAITLSPDLPVRTTILDIPEEQKVCQETGESLVQIGVEITHKLAHQPGSYFVKEIIRPKYVHPKKEEAGIIIADLPDCLLTGCRADESLLAEIISKKFADHLPLYR